VRKEELRTAARERLRGTTATARADAAAAMERNIWTLPEIAGARALLVYASLPSEAPTDGIAAEARRRGIIITYPRCLAETREMVIYRVDSGDELAGDGAYGIREPLVECPLVRLDQIDAALVPGLAWDRAGGRLGRGAGYYDRLFADPRWRGFRCGLFFSAQEVDSVPTDPWDAPLQAVVTESAVHRVG
jgi:5-formyltetrahydrofolate cyclo-ligase